MNNYVYNNMPLYGKESSLPMQSFFNNPEILNKNENLRKGPLSEIQTKFIATHKEDCRVAVFSRDGTLAATGSADMSIKILDVSKMHFHNQAKVSSEFGEEFSTVKPVVRTFYDNSAPVNDIDFHPTATLMISCSRDNSIKFFDHEKMIVKRAYNELVEKNNIKSVHFHPSGEYIISGGENPFIRIINVQNFKTFISRDITKQHKGIINQVRYNNDGKIYASCDKRGEIKFWNGQDNRCFRTIKSAHRDCQVFSVSFSEDSKLLLSCGADSTARLWDVSSGSEVLCLTGFKNDDYRSNAVFFHQDQYVLVSDKYSSSVIAFNKNDGQHVRSFIGHSQPIKWICASQSEPAFISCSYDHRARFWGEEF